jgi:hypothetical protein
VTYHDRAELLSASLAPPAGAVNDPCVCGHARWAHRPEGGRHADCWDVEDGHCPCPRFTPPKATT